jgi:hypothetical protein
MERKTKHPFKKEDIKILMANPFNAAHIVYSVQEVQKQTLTKKKEEQVIVFNCAWHNPSGSEERTNLEKQLKPNEVISDGMCEKCFEKYSKDL